MTILNYNNNMSQKAIKAKNQQKAKGPYIYQSICECYKKSRVSASVNIKLLGCVMRTEMVGVQHGNVLWIRTLRAFTSFCLHLVGLPHIKASLMCDSDQEFINRKTLDAVRSEKPLVTAQKVVVSSRPVDGILNSINYRGKSARGLDAMGLLTGSVLR